MGEAKETVASSVCGAPRDEHGGSETNPEAGGEPTGDSSTALVTVDAGLSPQRQQFLDLLKESDATVTLHQTDHLIELVIAFREKPIKYYDAITLIGVGAKYGWLPSQTAWRISKGPFQVYEVRMLSPGWAVGV